MGTVTDLGTNKILRQWPAPHDFNEAMQNHSSCIQDEELRSALVVTDAFGLPRPITGNFASVYQLTTPQGGFAIKCFLRNVPDQCRRYELISSSIAKANLSCLTKFDFLENGILVNGDWYPILKMQWLEGETLDSFVLAHIDDSDSIQAVAEEFKTVCHELNAAGIAHGDLQHANIIVTRNGKIKLVDYDGMFVSGMEGLASTELGHRNYQHPSRRDKHFGNFLDNFSALSIYTSLKAFALDPNLRALYGVEDGLLFSESDLAHPHSSGTFAALEQHHCAELAKLSRLIRWEVQGLVEETSPFWELPEVSADSLRPVELAPTKPVEQSTSPHPFLEEEWRALFHPRPDWEIAPELRKPRRPKIRRTRGSVWGDFGHVLLVWGVSMVFAPLAVAFVGGFAEGVPAIGPFLLIALVVSFVVIGFPYLVFFLPANRFYEKYRERRLCRTGQAVVCRVVSVNNSTLFCDFILEVSFPIRKVKGRWELICKSIRVSDWDRTVEPPQVGSELTLLYAMHAWDDVLIYEFSDYEVLPSAA